MLVAGDGALLAFPCYEPTETDPRHRFEQPHSFVDSFPAHPIELPAAASHCTRASLDNVKPYPTSSCFSAFGETSPIFIRDVPRSLEGAFHMSDGPVFYPDRHRDSVSSSNSSGSSFSLPESPVGSLRPVPSVDDEEGPWNLVSYHVPWGSAYEGYEAGTLPGPDGRCIFLRSPTPSKKQRTSQACEKCRERKAKCSGARPVCARCDARGHLCVYAVSLPQSHDGCAGDPTTAALPSRPSEQLPALLKLSKTSLTRSSRKDSIPESVSSLGGEHTPERRLSAEGGFGGVSDSDTALSGPTSSWSSGLDVGLDPHATSVSVRDIYPSAFSASSRGSTHAFSNFVSDADRLYIDSSGLDEYRFPPAPTEAAIGEIKAFDVVQTQPLALTSGPPHRLADHATGGDVGYPNLGWLCDKADTGWGAGQSEPGLEMGLEFSGPLSAAANHMLQSPGNPYSNPLGTAANYSLRPNSSHTMSHEGAFIGPEFSTVGQFEHYGDRNDYDIGWIPSEKT